MESSMSGIGQLDALLSGSEGRPMQLDIKLIHEDLNQPRREFDLSTLDELANSIKSRGVKSPISVRTHPDLNGAYIINHGARRLRAAKLAGLSTVPVIVEEDYLFEDQLIENIQREDLKPIEIALGIKNLLDAGMKKNEIAKKLGKSNAYITQHYSLLSLEEPIYNAFKDNKITDITTTCELNNLYKNNPKEVTDFLEKENDITRSAVKTFKNYLNSNQDEIHNDNEFEEADGREIKEIESAEAVSKTPNKHKNNLEDSGKIKKPIVLVEHQGLYARIILNKRPLNQSEVWIKFEDNGAEETVLCSQLKIISLMEA